ncbi:RcnB family protein [Mangrovicoccus algicola]|uniref:RcnB family protein n=1 Tax=Mangrovicoccus algicola TaxID=2771008 RepID=A0A8J6ZA29_9RHOB|nr:RcnB family protein [Mangrovicoccus algicola]MBE3639155.1 RcnB family protein [Mangrovicoccus algicola]
MMKTTMIAALCLSMISVPVLADKGGSGRNWRDHGGDRHEARRGEGRDGRLELAGNPGRGNNGKGVPPGLDKKPGNMPPGQYKKIHGDRIDWRDYRLPRPPEGQIYVRQGDQLYRVMRDTMIVAAALGVVSQYLR